MKIFLVCTRFHNEKSLPVRQITWIMLTKTEIMRTIWHFFGQNYFHNHDQNFKLCTHYENNFDQNFFTFSKLFIEPNFWTNFRFILIWNSVRLFLFSLPGLLLCRLFHYGSEYRPKKISRHFPPQNHRLKNESKNNTLFNSKST